MKIVATVDVFFKNTAGMVRILYCNENEVDAVRTIAMKHGCIVYSNNADKTVLRHNTAKHVHVVTEQRLMRGFDYRAPGVGFGLLLMRSLDSKRAYRQAIGRAGRMDDTGSWAKLLLVE